MPEEKALNGTKQNTEPASPLSGLAPMTKNQVMDIAMDLGKILLKSGAETSRVEDTVLHTYGHHPGGRKSPGQEPRIPGALACHGFGTDHGHQ